MEDPYSVESIKRLCVFDRNARRSGPTNHFVGLQRFTQKCTRNIRKLTNWIRLDQIGSEWIRLDQIGSDWIRLDQIGPDWTRLDQIGSDWIR